MIDTNVAVVANGSHAQARDECVDRCIDELTGARVGSRVLLDDQGLILDEYSRVLSRRGQPGVGDAFFRWLWDNQGNEVFCRKVAITPSRHRTFEEFPDDARLSRFDRSDRKFVAVALASGESPAVLNASDTDWWEHRIALGAHGIDIRFLCQDLMKSRT